MSLTYVTVTETFDDGTGSPLADVVVTLAPSQAVYSSGALVETPVSPVVAKVVNGALKAPDGTSALRLLATDNTGLTVSGGTGFWYWTVTVSVSGVQDAWSFFLPSSPATVELYATKNTASSGGAGAVSSVFGRTGAVTAQSGDYTAAEVGADASGAASAAQAAAEAASLPKAGGTLTGELAPAVVALTDAATIAVNAALGNVFTLLTTSGIGATRAIGAPSNPVDGQVIRFRITQAASGGPYAVTWNAVFDFGSGSAPSLTSTASKTDIVAFEYVATNSLNKWCYLGAAIPQGF